MGIWAGKQFSSNQGGQAPTEDAHSLKKQMNASRKTVQLDKDSFKDNR